MNLSAVSILEICKLGARRSLNIAKLCESRSREQIFKPRLKIRPVGKSLETKKKTPEKKRKPVVPFPG